jgi:hypothetical protein
MNKLRCKCSPDCQACACGWNIDCECEKILKCEHEFTEYIKCEHEDASCSKCNVKLTRWKMNFGGEEPLIIRTEDYCFWHKPKKEETNSDDKKLEIRFKCLTCFGEIKQSELETTHQKFVKGSAFGLQCDNCWRKEVKHE